MVLKSSTVMMLHDVGVLFFIMLHHVSTVPTPGEWLVHEKKRISFHLSCISIGN